MGGSGHDALRGGGGAPSTSIGLRGRAADTAAVSATLGAVALDLRRLWSAALVLGDFDELTRLIEASHAVQRAVISLEGDRAVSARSQ